MLVTEMTHKISSAQLGKESMIAFCKQKEKILLHYFRITVRKSHIPHTLMCYTEILCLHQAQNFITIYTYSDLDPRYFSKPTTQWMRLLNYSTK